MKRLVSFCIAALAGTVVARAEVSVIPWPGSNHQTLSGPLILGITGDEPDPVPPMAWRVYHLAGSGYAVLNPQGEANGDGSPSVAVNPVSGLAMVAWSRASASGFDVVVSAFQNGAWSNPTVVAGGSSDELDPSLTIAPDGTVHLFFWSAETTPRVYHSQAPPDLSSWSAAAPVSDPGVAACRPAGVVHEGVLRVAFEVHDFGYGQTPRQIVLARLDGGSWIPEVMAVTQNATAVWPQVHSGSGRLWVDWIDVRHEDGSGEMAWTRWVSGGTWTPLQYAPFANTLEREYHVRGGIRMQAIQ